MGKCEVYSNNVLRQIARDRSLPHKKTPPESTDSGGVTLTSSRNALLGTVSLTVADFFFGFSALREDFGMSVRIKDENENSCTIQPLAKVQKREDATRPKAAKRL